MNILQFVIVTGLSGAGKTVTLRTLEDLGYFCIDNLPPALIPRFTQLLAVPGNQIDRVALVVDVRGGVFFDEILQSIEEMEGAGSQVKVLFLEADESVLIKRFKETRRRHPLAREGNISEVLQWEKHRLQGLRDRAHYIIDTSQISPAELRQRLVTWLSDTEPVRPLYLSVVSFGFKSGVPRDADLVFDVRFLPNPYYEPDLRPLTGLDERIKDFVLSQSLTEEFFDRLMGFLDFLLPHYLREGKTQLNIAIGCTGGRHRSVVLAELVGETLRGKGYPVVVEHRGLSALRDPSAEGRE